MGANTGEIRHERAKRTPKIIAALGIACIAGLFMAPKAYNLGSDIVGHRDAQVPPAEVRAKVLRDYEKLKEQASPSQLFELRYSDSATLGKYAVESNGGGILGKLGATDANFFEIDDKCLDGTVYDINDNNLNFSTTKDGYLSYTYIERAGESQAARAQARPSQSDHKLTVRSDNSSSPDLTFSVRGTELSPANSTTRGVLGKYSCQAKVGIHSLSKAIYTPFGPPEPSSGDVGNVYQVVQAPKSNR